MALPPGMRPLPLPTSRRGVRQKANLPYQGARSTHAKEHTMTSPTRTLAQATAVLRYQTQTCTPDPTLLENDLCRKLLRSVAFCSLARRLTHILLNILLLVALPMPRRSTSASPRTRRKEEGPPRQKHSKGLKRRQHVARYIRLREDRDNRSQRSPNLLLQDALLQDAVLNNSSTRKPHRELRHRHCLRIP